VQPEQKTTELSKLPLILLTIICFFCGFKSNSQSCLPSGIVFTTQEAVDAFPQEYPDCKETGGINIQGDDITNLDSLIQLKKLNSFNAWGANNLISIDGLSNVDTITTNLFIIECPRLENLDGLKNLDVAESISIISNNLLKDISALFNIQEVQRILSFEKNPLLERINGFNNITSLVNLKINDNSSLSEIVGFNAIDTISNRFEIKDNPKIRRLDLLHDLSYIHENLDINNIDTLDVFSGFGKLEYADFLSIQRIYHTDSMPSFNALKRIKGNLNLSTIRGMRSFKGFQNLEYNGGSLGIIHLDSTQTLEAFEKLDTVGSIVALRLCNSLESLIGFNTLKHVGGSLSMSAFNELVTLDAFRSLNKIDGGLRMQAFKKLEIFPFESLENVNGRIWIAGNNKIRDLRFLDKLDYTAVDSISIFENDSLRICNTYPICKYLEEDIGPHDIRLNYEGCNSAEEILELCATNSTSTLLDSDIYLFPNPSNSAISISGLNSNQNTPIEIINAIGQPILHTQYSSKSIDISMLTPGTYYMKIQIEGNRRIVPFVKI